MAFNYFALVVLLALALSASSACDCNAINSEITNQYHQFLEINVNQIPYDMEDCSSEDSVQQALNYIFKKDNEFKTLQFCTAPSAVESFYSQCQGFNADMIQVNTILTSAYAKYSEGCACGCVRQ
ncbi:hypothetical protein L596_008934 [Steinernema carpocapsae]|uniref:Uncharacterized protein n=1 Tax=Steinernema carpocapsae TaxID=34508 RepID=A0A4U5PF21_STECR|nr:hypothetical protein L596_008934 [Steinernema carpocapsae]